MSLIDLSLDLTSIAESIIRATEDGDSRDPWNFYQIHGAESQTTAIFNFHETCETWSSLL